MIVDASAFLAILFAEDDAKRFTDALAAASSATMSAVNWFEIAIALDRRGTADHDADFAALLARSRTSVVSFDLAQAQHAREAYDIWGKGRHRAHLNMGDCAAYALARSRGEPLLFKGGDFALTDIERALKD